MSIELNRSAFEAFAQRNDFGTYRTDRKGDGYDSSHTQLMWMAWCAAIQQAESAPVLTVEKEPDYWSGGHFHEGQRPHIDPTKVRGLPIGTKLYTHPAPGVPDGWVSASDRVPLESDGEVFVRFTDGSIGTAWATYWHGASNEFAQWTHPDPDEDRTVKYWMKAPAIDAAMLAAKEGGAV